MNASLLLRIFIPGGVVSHNELVGVIRLCKKFNIPSIQFGLRQDINIRVDHTRKAELIDELNQLRLDFDINSDWSRNIVTSYVSNRVFLSESWLTEGTYLDILDTFGYKPQLRINIVDPNQGLVPTHTGHLNFIASKNNNYWYLHMELPDWFPPNTSWPSLIYSYDISKVSQKIEELYLTGEKFTVNELFEKINELIHSNSRRIDQELKLPEVPLPYYEGVNKSGNKYWLGMYMRDYLFNIDFLEATLALLSKNNINKICITPWRSLLIKGIKESEWINWVKMLGKYGINLRHSSLELNWRVPDFDSTATQLKQYLVKEFDKKDIRTYGLTFAIRTAKVDLDGMIMIERKKSKSIFKGSKQTGTYDIYHAKGFEFNQTEYDNYAKNVTYKDLPSVLEKVTQLYYDQQSTPSEEEDKLASSKEAESHSIYECKHCFTTYDEEFGDSTNYVEPGTSFKDIPNSFRCPVCDSPKSDFVEQKNEEYHIG